MKTEKDFPPLTGLQAEHSNELVTAVSASVELSLEIISEHEHELSLAGLTWAFLFQHPPLAGNPCFSAI
jgi:hypothetical protein